MDNPATERTPLVIAAEIKMITCQTKKILLTSAIEIGRHLQEAKAMLKHGEWIKWLEESVLLLGLPAEEREEFITHNDVGSMTKQELQQALKDRDQANQAKEQALQEKGQALQENQLLKKGLETIDSTISELKKEHAKALPRPTNPEHVNAEALSANDTSSAGDVPSATTAPFTHNLKTERNPDAYIKYVEKCDACSKTIADTFFDLTTALTNLAHIDPELKEEKRKAANQLIDYMAETIKVWPPPKKPLRVNS
ncbi:DUF3102 domain-containing protein [Dehalobacter restrictus]|uniref:DUF3102 domain-containing protein n=1 Tax=Dehalobacter restrictus TaxID=55583 RepID=A0A857DMD5_9FIRM|nr:DUF3102 domain-containing protein [Dehalobacter restrictus]QHA01256.1 DUF3102 domain-containing protein [Dehalobacter restrictus]